MDCGHSDAFAACTHAGMMLALLVKTSCGTSSSSCSVSRSKLSASQVMVSADLNNIPRVEFAFDCSFERKLVADFEAEQQNSSAGADPASVQVQSCPGLDRSF